ncbi:MAG: hypothetical protein ACQEWD_16095 [Bacteroidota bacterium]
MIYGVIIALVIIGLFMFGVFDSKTNDRTENPKQEMNSPNPWNYNKITAQLYFDIYVSEPLNGKYFILKIAENNFAAADYLDFPPEKSSKNELLLEMDNRAYDFPENNLSPMLGVCQIDKKDIKIYFAEKSAYHNGIKNPPFEYMSFEGNLKNKTLVFDMKRHYYDQSLKSAKIEILKENVHFNQL